MNYHLGLTNHWKVVNYLRLLPNQALWIELAGSCSVVALNAWGSEVLSCSSKNIRGPSTPLETVTWDCVLFSHLWNLMLSLEDQGLLVVQKSKSRSRNQIINGKGILGLHWHKLELNERSPICTLVEWDPVVAILLFEGKAWRPGSIIPHKKVQYISQSF